MASILLIGGGAHCKSVIESIENTGLFKVAGIIDVASKKGMQVLGYSIIGTDEELEIFYNKGITKCFISLGSIGQSTIREKLFKKAKAIGFSFPVIKDKSAIVSEYVAIDEGSFIGKGAIINVDAKIGANAIINSGAIVEHDCLIGAFTHVAPGATLSGNTIVGNHSHIGTNATIIQSITVGSETLIGAGSVVIDDIADNCIAFGNPCKKIK